MRVQSLFRYIQAKKLLLALQHPRHSRSRWGSLFSFFRPANNTAPSLSEYYARAIMHNFNSPLSICLSITQELKGHIPPEDHAYLEEALRTMQLILNSLRQNPDPVPETFSLTAVLERAIYLARYRGQQSGVRIFLQCSPNLTLQGPPAVLLQVLLNLLQNSLEALESPGLTQKNIFVSAQQKQRVIILEIQDTGPGIGPDPSWIFEPFYSIKPNHDGVGIIYVKDCLKEFFQGKISATSVGKSGTLIQITLPL